SGRSDPGWRGEQTKETRFSDHSTKQVTGDRDHQGNAKQGDKLTGAGDKEARRDPTDTGSGHLEAARPLKIAADDRPVYVTEVEAVSSGPPGQCAWRRRHQRTREAPHQHSRSRDEANQSRQQIGLVRHGLLTPPFDALYCYIDTIR